MILQRSVHKRPKEAVPSRRRSSRTTPSSGTSGSKPGNSQNTEPRSFRRNSTISSRGADQQSASPRATSHQLRRKRRSLGWLFVVAVGVALAIGFIVYQLTAEVTISLRGSLDPLSDANQSAYQKTLDKYFSQRPLERFRGLMRPESMAKYLQQSGHNEVESVASIDFASVGKTAVVLEVREPVARWIIDSNVQFVDKNGSVFTKNYFDSPNIKVLDKSGVTLRDSQTATSGRFLGFIGKSVGGMDAYGYKVKEVVIPPATTRQIQLRVTTGGVLIKMAIDRPVGEQAEDASRALRYLMSRRQSPQYIDVRVANKAYYR